MRRVHGGVVIRPNGFNHLGVENHSISADEMLPVLVVAAVGVSVGETECSVPSSSCNSLHGKQR